MAHTAAHEFGHNSGLVYRKYNAIVNVLDPHYQFNYTYGKTYKLPPLKAPGLVTPPPPSMEIELPRMDVHVPFLDDGPEPLTDEDAGYTPMVKAQGPSEVEEPSRPFMEMMMERVLEGLRRVFAGWDGLPGPRRRVFVEQLAGILKKAPDELFTL